MTGLVVAATGGLGAVCRYLLEGVIARRVHRPFPVSTLVVNVSGSFLLGVVVALAAAARLEEVVVTWAGAGFLGGFTTFSTFVYETLRLAESGANRQAAYNVVLSVVLSVGAAAAGFALV